MEILEKMADGVINGKADEVENLVKKALNDGLGVKNILDNGLIAGMHVVGIKFERNEFYVPEVLIAARAMSKGMEILRPFLEGAGVKPIAKFVIGTVRGDLHDIGKNLVSMMLKGAGFEVIDLGADVSTEKFLETVRKENAPIMGMSALLTTTMPGMRDVIEALKSEKLRDKVKVMVGGAPLTQEYADEIGADAYAPDAASAAEKAKQLVLKSG